MTNFPEISRRIRDRYHNLKDDDLMKNIFNSGRYKNKVGKKIPAWMISEEMKHTKHYQMYADVFRIDVPLTQSQPTESTQGTHRIPSAPRRSTRLTSPAPVSTVDKADEMILQDTLQVSLAKHKSQEEQEARENVELVNEHLASVEIEKMVKGQENVIDDSSIPRNDDQNIPSTRLEPRSDKESLKVEITNDEEVEISNVVIPVNVNKEEEEITDEVYELNRREKRKILEESRSIPFPTLIRSPRIYTYPVSSDTKKLQELTELQGCYRYLFEHLRAKFFSRKSFDTLVDHLQQRNKEETYKMLAKAMLQERRKLQAVISSQIQNAIDTNIPSMVDTSVPQTNCRTPVVRLRDQDDPHDDAHPEGENSAKRKKTSEYEAHEKEQDDDEVLTKQVSQAIMEEVSLTINEVELKKIADEMLRQRCTSGDEHQYHIDQMKNFLKSDIKGSSRPEKIVLLLHKFPAIIFNDDDIEEQTSRWELGHEHKFITEIVARRTNECIVSIIESDYKNLNKNDIEDMYLLIMNSKKVNLTAPTISFPGIEKHKMFSIIYEPVHGIIYKNSKKEKRVMRHSEIHKFCDATLNRVLEGLKSYNNNVKYGYIQRDLIEDEVEYLKLFKEEIELRLKYHNQMRR
ncbi:hypothetical protein Tco_1507312 [Tanacetum coccineum]